MKTLGILFSLVASIASASETEPEQPTLADLLWVSRAIVVFADTPDDPRFVAQLGILEANLDALEERDVVVLTDTDADIKSELRTKLRPRGFQLVLVGKDGQVKLRKPAPWEMREINRAIDKMPMRQQEMRARTATAN